MRGPKVGFAILNKIAILEKKMSRYRGPRLRVFKNLGPLPGFGLNLNQKYLDQKYKQKKKEYTQSVLSKNTSKKKKKKKITLYNSSKRKAKTSISLWLNRKTINTICSKSQTKNDFTK